MTQGNAETDFTHDRGLQSATGRKPYGNSKAKQSKKQKKSSSKKKTSESKKNPLAAFGFVKKHK